MSIIEQIIQAESVEELESLEPREDRGQRGVMTMWHRWPEETLVCYAKRYVQLADIRNTGEFEEAHEGLRKKILRLDNDEKEQFDRALHQEVLPQPSLEKIREAENLEDLKRVRRLGVGDWTNFSDEMVVAFAKRLCEICELEEDDLQKGGRFQDVGKKLRRIGAFDRVVLALSTD